MLKYKIPEQINEITCISCRSLTKTCEEKICYKQWFVCDKCFYINNILQKYNEIRDIKNYSLVKKFIDSIPAHFSNITGFYSKNYIVTSSHIDKMLENSIMFDNRLLTNCTNCKIAIVTHGSKNVIKNYINLCSDCFDNRKDILRTKTEALKEFFLKPDDLKNLRHNECKSTIKYHGRYNLYYTGDLLKKRNEKYNPITIAKLILARCWFW